MISLSSTPRIVSRRDVTPGTGASDANIAAKSAWNAISVSLTNARMSSTDDSAVTGEGCSSVRPNASRTATIRGSARSSVANVRDGSPSRPGR